MLTNIDTFHENSFYRKTIYAIHVGKWFWDFVFMQSIEHQVFAISLISNNQYPLCIFQKNLNFLKIPLKMTDDKLDEKAAYLQEWKAKRKAKGILHHFPEMLFSERLEYERLSSENYASLIPLFENDDSPFLDNRYKNEKAAQENLEFVQDKVYDTKCGGCDFLIKLKNTQQYIGVLHLFDYSLETFLDIPLRCTLGYAIAKDFRQKYYATEALKHLVAYANLHHGKKRFLVYTSVKNVASNRLMQSLSFRNVNEGYNYGKKGKNYYLYEID